MPLFTVTMGSGRTVAEKDAISAAIHEASVSAGGGRPALPVEVRPKT